MPVDLGARLVRAGLVTRELLQAALATSEQPAHGGALAATLVGLGVEEDAITGFLIADGYGPLVAENELAGADFRLLEQLPEGVAETLWALPLGHGEDGWIVAMADPSDQHAVQEIGYFVGGPVVPRLARLSGLRQAFARADRGQGAAAASRDRAATADRDPPVVIDLVRHRPVAAADGGGAGSDRAAPHDKARVRLPMGEVPHPANRSPWVGRYDGSTTGRAREAAKATLGRPNVGVEDVSVPLVRKKVHAPSPRREAAASPPFGTPITQAYSPLPPRPGDRQRQPTRGMPPPLAEGPAAAKVTATASPAAGGTGPPVGSSASSEPPRTQQGDPPDRWEDLPPPGITHHRLPVKSSAPPAKLSTRARRSFRPPSPSIAPPADFGTHLSRLRAAEDRDAVIHHACQAAQVLGTTVIFLTVRQSILRGHEGSSATLSRDALRNLWIPSTSPSVFRNVVATGQPYVGPHGQSAADQIFRAAIRSQGAKLHVEPVELAGRVVGILCVDEPTDESIVVERAQLIARSVAEAFLRIIQTQKV